MKKIILTFVGVAAVVIFLFGMNTINKKNIDDKQDSQIQNLPIIKNENGFALVELFTSEGCSSCPPADALVSKLAKEKKDNVFILSYHVDYWNRLGWRDKFSKAEFSKRQQNYANLLKLDGAYTPQIVVNGRIEFVGSNEEKLNSAIKQTKGTAAYTPLIVAASLVNNEILVKYKIDRKDNTVINFALVQLAGSSQVKNGENEGRFLLHTNIVADLKSIPDDGSKNQILFSLPEGFKTANYKIVTFLQNNAGEVIAAGDTSIN